MIADCIMSGLVPCGIGFVAAALVCELVLQMMERSFRRKVQREIKRLDTVMVTRKQEGDEA